MIFQAGKGADFLHHYKTGRDKERSADKTSASRNRLQLRRWFRNGGGTQFSRPLSTKYMRKSSVVYNNWNLKWGKRCLCGSRETVSVPALMRGPLSDKDEATVCILTTNWIEIGDKKNRIVSNSSWFWSNSKKSFPKKKKSTCFRQLAEIRKQTGFIYNLVMCCSPHRCSALCRRPWGTKGSGWWTIGTSFPFFKS